MKKRYALSAAAAVLMLAATPSLAEYVNPIAFPQKDDPNDIEVVIEIPAGTSTKYETDGKTGHLFVDRFLAMSVAYPANYGSIPSTIGPDGDPLDALVITHLASRQPFHGVKLIGASCLDELFICGRRTPFEKKAAARDRAAAVRRKGTCSLVWSPRLTNPPGRGARRR